MLTIQDHRTMQNAPLVGTGVGALGGAGLGALFSALSGMNPVSSLAIGAGLGGISGNVTGRKLRNMYNTSITGNEAAQLAQQFGSQIVGTNDNWLDPYLSGVVVH